MDSKYDLEYINKVKETGLTFHYLKTIGLINRISRMVGTILYKNTYLS